MEWLITLLATTVVYTNCPYQEGFTQYGYYIHGDNDVYICENNKQYFDEKAVIYHEIGHLIWFKYLGKTERGEVSESFANNFQSEIMRNSEKLKPLIIEAVKLGK